MEIGINAVRPITMPLPRGRNAAEKAFEMGKRLAAQTMCDELVRRGRGRPWSALMEIRARDEKEEK